MGYTLYGAKRSRAFRVIWMLHELEQPFDMVEAAPRSETLLALCPLGKSPIFTDGDTVIPDSLAIMTYLTDKHGAFTHPAGTLERAQQDAMTFRILDDIESLLWTAARHSFVLPEAERVPEVKATCRAEFARNMDKLAVSMAGDYVLGDTPLVPDFLLAHCSGWAENAKFPELPAKIMAHRTLMRERPAFVAASA